MITRYDIAMADFVEVTQEYFDKFVADAISLNQRAYKIAGIQGWRDKTPEPIEDFNFRLKVYPNPMRDDGVYIAEDRPLEPYIGIKTVDGKQVYPTIPNKAFRLFNQQIHPDIAEEIVKRWNYYQDCQERYNDNA